MLEGDAVLADAEAQAGFIDAHAGDLRPNLNRLLAAIDAEAGLSTLGEATVHKNLVLRTADRLNGLKWLRDHPEIGHEATAEAIFLTACPGREPHFFSIFSIAIRGSVWFARGRPIHRRLPRDMIGSPRSAGAPTSSGDGWLIQSRASGRCTCAMRRDRRSATPSGAANRARQISNSPKTISVSRWHSPT
jgi:hypothetical protein